MTSVPQISRNTQEAATNLSNTILLPNLLQSISFMENRRSWKRRRFESPQTRRQQKRLCRKIYREIIIKHTALPTSEFSQTSKMEPFVNMAEYSWLALELTIKSKVLVKKSWKMIMWHLKLNILPIKNESSGRIWDGLLYIWTRNYFYLIKSWKCAN